MILLNGFIKIHNRLFKPITLNLTLIKLQKFYICKFKYLCIIPKVMLCCVVNIKLTNEYYK